ALLTLPRELRDQIYSNLLLPEHVFTSTAKPDTYDLHRSTKKSPATYIDTRIYLPARPPPNVLLTCRQLREELLQFTAHVLNATNTIPVPSLKPVEESESNRLAARANTNLEEATEQAHDARVVRFTLEIERATRGAFGFYKAVRDTLSPRFLGLLPVLGPVKKIKFTVWVGFEWWSLPRQSRGRTVGKPNALFVAVEEVLKYLPLVEEIQVDVLMHVADYWNWDMADEHKDGVQAWLDHSVCNNQAGRIKRVYRRL
ncbi:hypothetical protein BDV96DRAFT_464652, partial [Lophiotrema nucula]